MNTILPPPITNFNFEPHSNNINQQLLSCNKIQNVNYPAQSTSSNTLIASSSFTSNDYASTLNSWIRQHTQLHTNPFSNKRLSTSISHSSTSSSNLHLDQNTPSLNYNIATLLGIRKVIEIDRQK